MFYLCTLSVSPDGLRKARRFHSDFHQSNPTGLPHPTTTSIGSLSLSINTVNSERNNFSGTAIFPQQIVVIPYPIQTELGTVALPSDAIAARHLLSRFESHEFARSALP